MILKACLDSDHDSESSSLSVVFSVHQRFAFPVQGPRKCTLTVHPLLAWPLKNPDPVSALLLRLQKDALSNIYHAHEVAVVSTHAASASDTRGEMQTADGPTSGERLPVAALSSLTFSLIDGGNKVQSHSTGCGSNCSG